MIIILKKNGGYSWEHDDNNYIRGFFIIKDEIFRGKKALFYLSQIQTEKEFFSFLQSCDGIFSIILKRTNYCCAAVDISRSIPLYYDREGSVISDCSEEIRKFDNISKSDVSPNRLLEFYETSCVVGNNTVYDRIKQISLGEMLVVTNDLNIKLYQYFIHTNKLNIINRLEAKKMLSKLSDEMVQKVIRIVGNRTIVLSLSGGYDSRYIACLLKKNGVKNVICYSYGRKNSFEIKESEVVAKALGFKWICIDYSDQRMLSIVKNNEQYFQYCLQHDFIYYLQNLPAVKYLVEKECIPNDSVFLTGLCNDMPSGRYILKDELMSDYEMNKTGVAKFIVNNQFERYLVKQEVFEKFVSEVESKIKIDVNDKQTFWGAVDSITTGYDHSRRFLPMNNNCEFFGYEWLIPCWDKILLNFWYSLPYEMRINQNLYKEWLMTDLFKQYGVNTDRISNVNAKTVSKAKIKRFLGSYLVRFSYPLGIPLKRNTDINNFAPLEVYFYKNIPNKKPIRWDRAGAVSLFSIYCMEQRYGKKCFEKIKVLLK